jgi:protein O-mannosyl-transferase
MKKEGQKKKSVASVSNLNAVGINKPSISTKSNKKIILTVISFLLIIPTVIFYSPVTENDFINFDDDVYITSNHNIQSGITWKNIKWAFTATYANNWHPLTWLSHLCDIEMFGLNSSGHHFTNLIFHIIAILLLFGFLYYATGKLFPSTLTAVLFALHPLHVESVAWAAERKDVLSTVLWFATMWSYSYYSRHRKTSFYLMTITLFMLGIMAKPMLVTLPVVLILFDFWPLQAFEPNRKSVKILLLEKLPFLLISTVSSAITLIAQQEAIGSFDRISLPLRVSNAIVSYCIYLKQCFWPLHLSIFYPYEQYKTIISIFCFLILLLMTFALIRFGLLKKYLLMGWLWYVSTLLPVIGLIQVGEQSHADRYTYIPFVGLFIAISWGLDDLFNKWQHMKKSGIFLTMLIIIPLLGNLTMQQVKYWKNSITLFSHAIKVTRGNYLAFNNLGVAFEKTGHLNEAIGFYEKALTGDSNYADANYNIAVAFVKSNKIDDAIRYYKKVLEIRSDDIKASNNLAGAYLNKNELDSSIFFLKKALFLAKASRNESMVIDITNNLKYLEQRQHESQMDSGQYR